MKLVAYHYQLEVSGEVPAANQQMAEMIVRNAISISARLMESECNISLFVNEVREDDDMSIETHED